MRWPNYLAETGDGRIDIGRARHIGGAEHNVGAEFDLGQGKLFLLEIEQRDPRTRLQKETRRGQTDATRSASDQGCAPRKIKGEFRHEGIRTMSGLTNLERTVQNRAATVAWQSLDSLLAGTRCARTPDQRAIRKVRLHHHHLDAGAAPA